MRRDDAKLIFNQYERIIERLERQVRELQDRLMSRSLMEFKTTQVPESSGITGETRTPFNRPDPGTIADFDLPG
jgi:hypothetical protein